VGHACVRDLSVRQVQRFQIAQAFEVLQPGIGNAGSVEMKLF
jgi:hypothetical protein